MSRTPEHDELAELRQLQYKALEAVRDLSHDVAKLTRERDRARAWAKNWHKIARTAYSQFGLLWNAAKGEETIGQRIYYYFLYKETLNRLGKMRAAARKAISICEHGHSELHAVLAMLERSDLPKDETVEQKTIAKLGKRVAELEEQVRWYAPHLSDSDIENEDEDQ